MVKILFKHWANLLMKINTFGHAASAVDYNAAGSGGNNKAASNKEYLQQVQARIDTF